MRRAFSFPARFVFSWSEHVLVAERADRIIGGIVLKLFSVGKHKVGFVSWLFTDPEAQGLGAGQALVERALDFFTAQGISKRVVSEDLRQCRRTCLAAHKANAAGLMTGVRVARRR